MTRPARSIAIAAALALPALATAAEYRALSTSDGRTLACEVLATEAAGLRVALPQGEMLVPFNLLRDMVPIDDTEYDAQPPWTVYVPADSAYRSELVAALTSLSAVQVVGEPGAVTSLTPAQEARAAECGLDLTCIASFTSTAPWMWLVMAQEDGTLRAALNTGATSNVVRPEALDPDSLRVAVSEALELGSANELEPSRPVKPPKETREPRGDGDGLVYAPVPGLNNLRQGDSTGFALAWAAVVPATALWVGAVGKSSQSVPETAILGVAGFYAITVVANHALGQRAAASDRSTLGVAPTEAEGASVVVSGSFR